MMQKRFSLGLALSLGALAALSSGCEVSTCTGDDCEFGDGDGSLFDGDDDGSDGDTDGDDDGSDGSDLDAGTDGDGDGSDGALTLAQFCEAFNAKGTAWREKMTECCLSAPLSAERSEEAADILKLFGYTDGSIDGCITANQALIDQGLVTFDGTKAQACADVRNAVFPDPPATCPTGDGFPYWQILGVVGHGVQAISQFEACRETFAGKLRRDEACPSATAHIQCADGLVCRPGLADEIVCQPPLTSGNTCTRSGECGEGLMCAGVQSAMGQLPVTNRRCIPVNDLLVGVECTYTEECIKGSWCSDSSGKCEDIPTELGETGATECLPGECHGYCDIDPDAPEGTTGTCAPLCAAD